MLSPPLHALKKTLTYQAIVIAVVLGFFLTVAKINGLSVIYPLILSYLMGAGIFVVANAYFTVYAFLYAPRADSNDQSGGTSVTQQNTQYNAQQMLSFVTKGQKGKFVLSAVLFATAFSLCDLLRSPLNVAALFTGYITLAFSQWSIAKKLIDQV